ncbi:MAG TPA: L-lactate permease [Candidatus Acidoferrales bacterium]
MVAFGRGGGGDRTDRSSAGLCVHGRHSDTSRQVRARGSPDRERGASASGVMGKIVDAQSITIATSATNQVGNEGMIFRFVVWHSVALGAIVGVIVMLYAYVFAWAVPHGLTFIK